MGTNNHRSVTISDKGRADTLKRYRLADSNSAQVCLQEWKFAIFTVLRTSADDNINKIVYNYIGKDKGQLGEH